MSASSRIIAVAGASLFGASAFGESVQAGTMKDIAAESAGVAKLAWLVGEVFDHDQREKALRLEPMTPGDWAGVRPAGFRPDNRSTPRVAGGDFAGPLGLANAPAALLDEGPLGASLATFGPRMDPELDAPSDGPRGPVVPLPSAAFLGFAGLSLIGVRRRR